MSSRFNGFIGPETVDGFQRGGFARATSLKRGVNEIGEIVCGDSNYLAKSAKPKFGQWQVE